MSRGGWLAFGAFVALNAVWLFHDVRRGSPDPYHLDAYAECRTEVRRARDDAARIPFPTADLVTVSGRGSSRLSIRGFYEPRGRTTRTWYRCDVEQRADSAWHVEALEFDR